MQIADELKAVRRELGKLPLQKQPEPEYNDYATVYDYASSNGYDTDHRLMVALGHIASEVCRQKGIKKGAKLTNDGPYRAKGSYPVVVLDEVFAQFARRKGAAV